jgi:copper(I)-binding protein
MTIKRRDLLLTGGSLLGGAALGLFAPRGAASAHEYDVGKLKIEHPWVRAPKDGETKAYFYAVIYNNGDAADRLVAVKSPHFGSVALHADAKHAEAVGGIDIAAKKKTKLAPDAGHVLLVDVKKHLEVGWGLEMTLVFEKAGEVTIDAAIDAPDAKHAHDAEAMERWQKAHGQDSSGPAPSGHDHSSHKHHDAEKGGHDDKK